MEINVLGTPYRIIDVTCEEDARINDCDGYCDSSIFEIGIDATILEPKINSLKNLTHYRKKVLRHEIVHAFLFESGLASNSDFAFNEELVDWIAIQFPKMLKVFQEVDAL